MGTTKYVSRFEVVQKVTRRIKSALAEDRAQSWESVRDRIKTDFAEEFRVLHKRTQITYPDGSDLIAEVVGDIAPQVPGDTVRKMRDALVSAADNSPRPGALWSSTRKEIISKNSMAIGMLAQHDQSAPDGDALLSEALQELSGRVWFVTHKVGGEERKYLTNRRPAEHEKRDECDEGNDGGKTETEGWPILLILRWVAVLLSITAAIAALIGVTVWDILPIPCDLPLFSWLPRC